MDVIEEDSEHFSEIFEVPHVSLNGLGGGGGSGSHNNNHTHPLEDNSIHSESTADISDSETDFAKQLRKQRKQVLEEGGGGGVGGGAKKQSKAAADFSQILRQHREELVETWGDHPHQTPEKAVPTLENNNNDIDIDVASSEMESSMPTTNGTHRQEVEVEEEVHDHGNFGAGFREGTTTEPDNISEISGAAEDFGDEEGGVVQEAISFESLEGNISFDDSADEMGMDTLLPPGTPSRVLDELLAVTPNSSDGAMPDPDLTEPASDILTPMLEPCTDDEKPTKTDDFGDVDSAILLQSKDEQSQSDAALSPDMGAPPLDPKNDVVVDNDNNDDLDEALSQSPQNEEFDDFAAPEPAVAESTQKEGVDLGRLDASQSADDPEPSLVKDSPEVAQLDHAGGFDEAPSQPTNEAQSSPMKDPDMAQLDSEDDDFGGFDEAPSPPADEAQSSPMKDPDMAQPDNEDDDVGGFDEAPSPPAEEAQSSTVVDPNVAQPDNEDDNFGGFDEVPSQPTNHQELSVVTDSTVAQPNRDDDFGGFDEARSQPTDEAQPSPVEDPQAAQPASQPDDGDDCFGDIDGSGETSSHHSGAQPASVTEQDVAQSDDDDAFGDFDGAGLDESASQPTEPQPSPVNDAEVAQPDNDYDFGGFDEAPPQPSEAQLSPAMGREVVQPDDGDDFGDFGGSDEAPSQPRNQAETSPPTDSEAAQTEDANGFGDFGGVDEAPSQPTDAAESSQALDTEVAQPNDDGEDFGDFGGFDEGPSQPSSEAQSSPVEDQEVAQPDDEDDNFGSFGGLDEAPSQPINEVQSSPVQDTDAVQPDDEDDAFGDFGGFEEAPSQPSSETQSSLGKDQGMVQPEDDEDFGDFGGFDAAPSQPTDAARLTPVQNAKAVEPDNDDDDDFGDFGGFDEAPSQPPTEAQPSPVKDEGAAQPNNDDDDDFGDFGGFDEAPSTTANKESQVEGHDDFGDFDAVSSQPASKAPAVATRLGGQELEAARTLLARLQSKYTFAEIEPTDEPVSLKETLSDFMERIETKDSTENLSGSATLIQWLSELDGRSNEPPKDSVPKRIIENDGRGPFAQFGFPIAGLPTAEQEIGRQKRVRRVSLAASRVPDVLPIQLPTGEENPLEAASPKSKKRSQPAAPSLNGETKLQIPQLEESDPNDTSKKGHSAAVKELLRKIPDLSFMLESKLVLPTK